MARHTLARSLHDVGLATWFGGSLMGAVGLNGAAASLVDPAERSAAATVGWNRWAPVNAAAVGAHLIGAVQLLRTERGRIRRQDGVAKSSVIKTALTAAALGTTAYSGILNRHMAAAGHVPVTGATEPSAATPADVASTQKQLQAVQWLIPSLTGGLVAVTAWQSEQMRPKQVLFGSLPSLPSLPAGLPKLVSAGAGVLLLTRVLRARRSKAATGRSDITSSPATLPAPPSPLADAESLPVTTLTPGAVTPTSAVTSTSSPTSAKNTPTSTSSEGKLIIAPQGTTNPQS